MFAPIMGWITHGFGWPYVFFVMGGDRRHRRAASGSRPIHSPKDHPRISPAELEHIEQGGGLVDMDRDAKAPARRAGPKRSYLRQLLGNRMLLGVYIGQYCITTSPTSS